jgi:hypothetical protein
MSSHVLSTISGLVRRSALLWAIATLQAVHVHWARRAVWEEPRTVEGLTSSLVASVPIAAVVADEWFRQIVLHHCRGVA